MKECMTQMLQGFILGAGSFSRVLAVQCAVAQKCGHSAVFGHQFDA